MPKLQLTKTLAKFAAALDPDGLNGLGRDAKFHRRERGITPANLIPSLIAALGSGKVTTLTELCFWFNELAGLDVAEKTFWERLANPAFPVMMQNFVERLSGQLILQSLRFLPGSPFSRFGRILAQDGSSFAVHKALSKIFPGRFTRVSPAAVELHPTYDILHEAPVLTILTPDSHSERDCLPLPEDLEGDLLLADRGYPSFCYLAEVRDAGGFFIMRTKSDLMSSVLGRFVDGTLVSEINPIPLKDFLAAHPHQLLDLLIQPCAGNHGSFRIVILPTPKGLTRLITDLPASDFPPDVVGLAYRLRWQVELMFKDWKSYANLHRFATRNPHIAEGLIWASVATALLKRFVGQAAQMVGKVAVSALKTARRLPAILPKLIAAALAGLDDLEKAFADALEAVMRHAKRSNTRRERRIGRQKLGLRPVF